MNQEENIAFSWIKKCNEATDTADIYDIDSHSDRLYMWNVTMKHKKFYFPKKDDVPSIMSYLNNR